MPVSRGGDAKGIALSNWLAQHVEKCLVDARVLDAGRREKKSHESPLDILLFIAAATKTKRERRNYFACGTHSFTGARTVRPERLTEMESFSVSLGRSGRENDTAY